MKNIIKYGLLSLVAAAGVSCESMIIWKQRPV